MFTFAVIYLARHISAWVTSQQLLKAFDILCLIISFNFYQWTLNVLLRLADGLFSLIANHDIFCYTKLQKVICVQYCRWYFHLCLVVSLCWGFGGWHIILACIPGGFCVDYWQACWCCDFDSNWFCKVKLICFCYLK